MFVTDLIFCFFDFFHFTILSNLKMIDSKTFLLFAFFALICGRGDKISASAKAIKSTHLGTSDLLSGATGEPPLISEVEAFQSPSLSQTLTFPITSEKAQQHSRKDGQQPHNNDGERKAPMFTGMAGLTPDLANWMHSGVEFGTNVLQSAMMGTAEMFSPGGKFASLLPGKLLREQTNATELEGNATTDGSHRRRVGFDFDTDLTELAAMVISAVQSGECLQRSICLMGSRIGKSDTGTVGLLLADKLVPENVQGSPYFVTMKKALRGGESYCDRFRCTFK